MRSNDSYDEVLSEGGPSAGPVGLGAERRGRGRESLLPRQ